MRKPSARRTGRGCFRLCRGGGSPSTTAGALPRKRAAFPFRVSVRRAAAAAAAPLALFWLFGLGRLSTHHGAGAGFGVDVDAPPRLRPAIWIWNDADDREAFERLPAPPAAADEAEPESDWMGYLSPPTLNWTVRSLEARRRAGRNVAALANRRERESESEKETPEAPSRSFSRCSSADRRPGATERESSDAMRRMLGTCGAEYLRLADPGNAPTPYGNGNGSDAADDDGAGDDIAMYVLVYNAEQLSRIPEDDPRYLAVDQTRDASLAIANTTRAGTSSIAVRQFSQSLPLRPVFRTTKGRTRIAVRQFTQLLPLRPVFQAQLSELGAVLAVADVIAARRASSDHAAPSWVGINPVKRMLQPHLLDAIQLNNETGDGDTVFFWTTCCGESALNKKVIRMNAHMYPDGAGTDLDRLHLDVARAAFGDGYNDTLPQLTWPLKGGYLMRRSVFLEFACFCRVFAAHFLDRYVTTAARRRGHMGKGGGANGTEEEWVRPELFVKPEAWGHANTLERSWGYFMERLLPYWVYNAGYGLTMIDGGDNMGADHAQRNELRKRGGRWSLLLPVAGGNESMGEKERGETRRALRTCSSSLVCVAGEGPADEAGASRRIQCPHLYTDMLE